MMRIARLNNGTSKLQIFVDINETETARDECERLRQVNLSFVTRNFNLLMISRKLTKARKYLPNGRAEHSRAESGGLRARYVFCALFYGGNKGLCNLSPNNIVMISIIICSRAFSCFVCLRSDIWWDGELYICSSEQTLNTSSGEWLACLVTC